MTVCEFIVPLVALLVAAVGVVWLGRAEKRLIDAEDPPKTARRGLP